MVSLELSTEIPWKLSPAIGDVVYLESFGQGMVILGSLEACTDLLDRRSANYSDRPRMVMVNEL
jgi:hypothetical protein